jgi:hypothetical protein
MSTFQITGYSYLSRSATSIQNFLVGAHLGHVEEAFPLENMDMALM